MIYTFNRKYQARTISGAVVTVPDQVATAQRDYDGKTFPVLRRDGTQARARLLGDEYGLYSTGTGEMVVRMI